MARTGSSRPGPSSSAAGGRNTRRKRKEEESIMDEYQDMLADTYDADPTLFSKDTTTAETARPRKRPGAGASVRKNATATAATRSSTVSAATTDSLKEAGVAKTTPARKSISVEIPIASSASPDSTRKRRRVDDYDGHLGNAQNGSPSKTSPSKTKEPENVDDDMTGVDDSGDDDDEGEAVMDDDSEYESEDELDDDDDDSDVDWENIDLNKPPAPTIAPSLKKQPSNLTVDVSKHIAERNKSNRRRPGTRRKPPTPLERKVRLEIHKMHVLCMLAHTNIRSNYCNDVAAQKSVRKAMDRSTVKGLTEERPAYDSSAKLRAALGNAIFDFRRKFKVMRPGLRKPLWRDEEGGDGNGDKASAEYPSYGDDAISLDEFRAAAVNMEGSRDLGAQLFCAMLRGLGLATRLVANLQVLSYTFQKSGRKESTEANKPAVKPGETVTERRKISQGITKSGGRSVGEVNSNYGGPGPNPADFSSSTVVTIKKPQVLPTMNDPIYPVYWVEVFDQHAQEWVTVDPLVTRSVKKPLSLEPPMSESHEIEMAYVVAFESEGQAKDVTRRYVKSFNGRTRLIRVENTAGGAKWWVKALKPFRRGYTLDRDQIEEACLSQRDLAEGVPNNVQAFKNHPLFALEQLCRRNEVIHPKRQVASMPPGRGKKGAENKPIPVYRRDDVKIVKTARQWYMLGREIKIGEQPLKIQVKKPSRLRRKSFGDDGDEDDSGGETNQGMYAEHQTAVYEPPAVMFGLIPKNDFGNIDIFVPSMVPSGAVHMTRNSSSSNKLLAKAAKTLDVDYADAVVGFDHKGRTATAIIRGIVVAEENVAKVESLVAEMEAEIAEVERFKKQVEMLKLWRKFLIGLRIVERLDEYGPVEGGKGKVKALDDYGEDDEEEEEEKEEGGFLRDGEDAVMETGGGGFMRERYEVAQTGGCGGFFLADDDEGHQMNEEAGGFLKDDDNAAFSGGGFISEDDGGGGGFIPEEGTEDNGGGGFIPGGSAGDNGGGGGFIPEDDESTTKAKDHAEDVNTSMVVDDEDIGDHEPPSADKEDDEPLVPQHEEDEEIGEDDFEYDEDDGVEFDD